MLTQQFIITIRHVSSLKNALFKENLSIYTKIHHTSLKPCQVNSEPSFLAGILFNMGVPRQPIVQPHRCA